MKSPDLNVLLDNLQKLDLKKLLVRVEVRDGRAPDAVLVTHTVSPEDRDELRTADEEIGKAIRPAMPKKWFLDSTDFGKVRVHGKPMYERTYVWMASPERSSNTEELRRSLT